TGDTFQLASARGGPAITLNASALTAEDIQTIQSVSDVTVPVAANGSDLPDNVFTQSTLTAEQADRSGVVVAAVSLNNFEVYTAAGALAAKGVAGGVGGTYTTHTINTKAHIDAGATINPASTTAFTHGFTPSANALAADSDQGVHV